MSTTQERRGRRTGRASARARANYAESREAPQKTAGPADEAEAAENGKPKRSTGEKRARLNGQVASELKALRSTLTQCLDAIDLRVGGSIAEMLQVLEGDQSLEARPKPLTVKAAQEALADLATLSVSKKGRPRDLRRIEKLVRRLRKLLPA
jgi:hypothetical protein